jgi:hypothetical protein
LNTLILQLAILFLPGLIWSRLDAQYALKSKPTDSEFLLRAFLFGLVSYAVTFLIYSALRWEFTLVNLADLGTQSVVTRAIFKETLCATGVGLVLAVLWIYAATYKLLSRALQFIGATAKYGDEDVWDFTLNSSVPAVEYVHYRDFDKQIVYAGWVRTFSETDKLRELVLQDAEIFNFEGKLLGTAPLLYLSRAPDNIHLEFPYGDGAPEAGTKEGE